MALNISIEYESCLNRSIWLIDGTLTGTTTTPDQSEPGSNDNESILYTPQISKPEASPPNGV